jgi:hypothetical protein
LFLRILTKTLIFEVKTGGAVTLESNFRFTAHPKYQWGGASPLDDKTIRKQSFESLSKSILKGVFVYDKS